MIHDTQSAQISQKQDECNIYVTMKTMYPPGFVATHALGHIMRTSWASCVHHLGTSWAHQPYIKFIVNTNCDNNPFITYII